MTVGEIAAGTYVVGERKVRYLGVGRGPSVVLLHGGGPGYSADVWRGNMEGIADHGLRVLALDLPGYGGTDLGDDFSEAGVKQFLWAWLDVFGILDKVGLVGHSHAGRMAAEMALARPNRISGLVVVGTGSMLPKVEGAPEPKRTRPTIQPPRGVEPTREHVRAAILADVFDESVITEEALETRYQMSIGSHFAVRQKRAEGPSEREQEGPIWHDLDRASFPVLYVFGRQDQGETVQERIELLQRICPSIQTCVIDRAKHLVQWDGRARFNEVVGAFFAAR
jgi:4,5:9,10-diseco-3-hydroxy-5,9,17-trioxoandrosta-1(10),2-diene-4-oate hydrolase